MKKKGILAILIAIVIIASFLFINQLSKKSTFEELVIDKMSNTNFELIDIGKKDMNTYSREQAYVKDSLDIDKTLEMLNNLKLLEVKSIPVEKSPEASYYMDLIIENDSYVYLDFYEPSEYIRIGVYGTDFKMEKAFKIIENEIDFKFLNNIIDENISNLP